MPVEIDKRKKLIKDVEENGMTIKVAAHNLKINYSTAKHIVKQFKRTGKITSAVTGKRKSESSIISLENEA